MNSIWILILFTQFGVADAQHTNKLTTQEFSSRQLCMSAGNATKQLTRGSAKEIKFTCVKK